MSTTLSLRQNLNSGCCIGGAGGGRGGGVVVMFQALQIGVVVGDGCNFGDGRENWCW